MSSISIDVNGIGVATIRLAGMDAVYVHVHGALDNEQKVTLCASGGNYTEGGCGHLFWISDRGLLPGDIVNVKFNETCECPTLGKTIAELYPDAEPSTEPDLLISDDMMEELRVRPRVHEGFLVRAATSFAQHATAQSDDLNTDFAFDCQWDRFRPDQARVRLATYCFDDVLAKRAHRVHLKATLSFGQSAELLVVQ